MLIVRVLATVGFFSIAGTHADAFSQESSSPIVLETVHEISILDESTADERDWIEKKNRGGFIVAGSQFTNVGKLLIKGPGERTEACSGALIGADKFLTAAHCVCPVELFSSKLEEETYAQACRRRMSELTFKIVFLGIGIFEGYSKAEIMDDYVPLHLGTTVGVTRNADLAVISLVNNPGMAGVQRGQLTEDGLRVTVGYGLHSFKIVPEDSGYVADNTYDDGPKQIAKYLDGKFSTSWEECGEGAGLDTFCGEYNPVAVKGKLADAGACNGDSGAPLFELGADGKAPTIVGVTSYVYPSPKGTNPCAAAAKAMTFFVDVDRYSGWLNSQQSSSATQDQITRTCRSTVLIGPGSLKLKVPKSTMSLVAYDFHDPAKPNQRPTTSITETNDLKCVREQTFGIHSCEASKETTLSISIGPSPFDGIKPLSQLVICEMGE